MSWAGDNRAPRQLGPVTVRRLGDPSEVRTDIMLVAALLAGAANVGAVNPLAARF